uniref:Protein LTV1 homolog n=1 Tax=Strigamia maritima TaxID=126957 RepID=T1J085_STRMM
MGKTGKNKRFIDKKKSVTYNLIHRSQKDPLAADEDAPGYVLQPVGRVNKEIKEVIERKLPSVVFASAVEEEVGLLNKAALVRGPRPDWDPDIAATFDDEFVGNDDDSEVDFILKRLNADVVSQKDSDNECDSDDELWEDFDDDDKSETKSRFTEYSVSSSVLPRNKGLQHLDDQFETIYEQYDDEEIGALHQDDIVGCLSMESGIFKQIVEDYEKQKASERNRQYVQHLGEKCVEDDDESEDVEKYIVEVPLEKWDCESILSKNSTLYNHPQLIKESSKRKPIPIRVFEKTGIPKDTLKEKLTPKNLKQLDQSFTAPIAPIELLKTRKKHEKESPEEKHNRKQAVKELRRERRIEKKLNKEAFKEEKKVQEKILVNVHNKLQTIKLN